MARNYVNLNKLFKKLWYYTHRFHDLFNDESKAENASLQTFYYFNICAHGLCMLINTFENNAESIGFDVSTRAIIESLAIVKAAEEGYLTDKQIMLIYCSRRYSSSDEFGRLYGSTGIDSRVRESIEQAKKEPIADIMSMFGVSEKRAIRLITTQFSFLEFNKKPIGRINWTP